MPGDAEFARYNGVRAKRSKSEKTDKQSDWASVRGYPMKRRLAINRLLVWASRFYAGPEIAGLPDTGNAQDGTTTTGLHC